MKNNYQCISLYLLLLILGTSCRGSERGNYSVDLENRVEYRRIASTSVVGDILLLELISNNEESQRIFGLSRAFYQHVPAYLQKKVLGSSSLNFFSMESFEYLIAQNPDLILMSDWAATPNRINLLNSFNIPYHILSLPLSVNDVENQIRALALLLGLDSAGEILIERVHEAISALNTGTERLRQVQSTPLTVLDFNQSGQSASIGSTFHLLTELMGLDNLGSRLSGELFYGYRALQEEALFLLNPDILFVDAIMKHRLESEPIFSQLSAVQNQRIIVLRGDVERAFYSASPHMFFAARLLQKKIMEWLLP